MNINQVNLGGRLTRDPELRMTPNGLNVCTFSLAVTDHFKDKKETLFIDITTFAKAAENCAKFLCKGARCYVEGRLKLDSWDDKQTGQKRSKISVLAGNVQFIDFAENGKPQQNIESAPQDIPVVETNEEPPF